MSSYRVDVCWNGRRMARRWIRVAYRVYPGGRIYANRDEDSFYYTCEGAQTTQAARGYPFT